MRVGGSGIGGDGLGGDGRQGFVGLMKLLRLLMIWLCCSLGRPPQKVLH